MRSIVVGVLVASACEAPHVEEPIDAMVPIDANRCANPRPPVPTDSLPEALAQVDLNGTWTLTGTRDYGPGPQPYTARITLCRSGTGWCQCDDVDGITYADDTFLYESFHDLRYARTRYVYINAVDATLAYRSWEWQTLGGNQGGWRIVGVLTR